MVSASITAFPLFRLDTINEYLGRHRGDGDDDRIRLTPTDFAVSRYPVENAGRPVGQREIPEAVWPDTFVQPGVVKSQILGIRRAVDEDPKQFSLDEETTETEYQFIAPIGELPASKHEPLDSFPSYTQEAYHGTV
jgi:DNA-binding winged helix-turn-helix (wHTH) protein